MMHMRERSALGKLPTRLRSQFIRTVPLSKEEIDDLAQLVSPNRNRLESGRTLDGEIASIGVALIDVRFASFDCELACSCSPYEFTHALQRYVWLPCVSR